MIFNMSEALPQKPSEGKDENRRWKSLPAHSTCLIFHIISRAMCVCVCFSPLCPGEIPKNYKNGNIFFSVLPTPHRLARVPDVDVSSISFSIFIHEARQGNNNVHPPSGPNTHIHYVWPGVGWEDGKWNSCLFICGRLRPLYSGRFCLGGFLIFLSFFCCWRFTIAYIFLHRYANSI